MHPITSTVFELYDQMIRQLQASQKDLSINIEGINILDEACLDAIYHFGPIKPSKLAAELGVTKPAVTQILNKYETLGLVDKKAASDDKRSVLVSLKPHIAERFIATYFEFDQSMIQSINQLEPDDQVTLHRLLKKLIKGMVK